MRREDLDRHGESVGYRSPRVLRTVRHRLKRSGGFLGKKKERCLLHFFRPPSPPPPPPSPRSTQARVEISARGFKERHPPLPPPIPVVVVPKYSNGSRRRQSPFTRERERRFPNRRRGLQRGRGTHINFFFAAECGAARSRMEGGMDVLLRGIWLLRLHEGSKKRKSGEGGS